MCIRDSPMDKAILRKWLKCGYIFNKQMFPTEEGTPQGGIISPTPVSYTHLDVYKRQLLILHFSFPSCDLWGLQFSAKVKRPSQSCQYRLTLRMSRKNLPLRCQEMWIRDSRGDTQVTCLPIRFGNLHTTHGVRMVFTIINGSY